MSYSDVDVRVYLDVLGPCIWYLGQQLYSIQLLWGYTQAEGTP